MSEFLVGRKTVRYEDEIAIRFEVIGLTGSTLGQQVNLTIECIYWY